MTCHVEVKIRTWLNIKNVGVVRHRLLKIVLFFNCSTLDRDRGLCKPWPGCQEAKEIIPPKHFKNQALLHRIQSNVLTEFVNISYPKVCEYCLNIILASTMLDVTGYIVYWQLPLLTAYIFWNYAPTLYVQWNQTISKSSENESKVDSLILERPLPRN